MTLFAILLTFHYITAQFYDFLRIYQSDILISYKKSRQEKTYREIRYKRLLSGDYSPSTGASSSSLTMVSISPDFSPVLVFTKKYFMKIFGAAALGAPCLLS